MIDNPLSLHYDFSHLSLKDLLEARDTYHYHLLSKANVVGTAIGLYLIRKEEAWPKAKGQGESPSHKLTFARTFANSEVRDYSWPCVLALVRDWAAEEEFGPQGRYEPSLIVPKTLFMPDGRAVPVCVVQVKEVPANHDNVQGPPDVPPAYQFGGGLPIYVSVQGAEYQATAGCLVTDGHLEYALTARHVCGEKGTPVTSRLRGGVVPVGESSGKELTRKLFSEVYPDFPGKRSYASLDVGLIRIDDVNAWTSNTYGLPPLGALADVHEINLTLRLIDQKVMGYGAASGLLRGSIKALFYRHRSVGGYDYIGDFLISPDDGPSTREGDSGMVWNLDLTGDTPTKPVPLAQRDLRPLAVEWGGQVFEEGGRRSAFAVATSLSNVCKLLDVELVTDRSRGVSGYWGRTGHYSIATFAISMVGDARLKTFLAANADSLSFDLESIAQKGFDKSVGQLSAGDEFVPLADVPDEIWKKLPADKGGRTGGRDVSGKGNMTDGPEHPNHYADIDAPFDAQGRSWRAICLADPDKITPDAWLDFYRQVVKKAKADGDDAAAKQYAKKFKQGLLPFRVWQFFDAMEESVSSLDMVSFIAAAGLVAHYVGDGSQPLHGSVFADGDPSRTVTRQHPNAKTEDKKTEVVPFAKGVHSAYESAMVSFKAGELIDKVKARLPAVHGLPLCKTGKDCAQAILELMDKAAGILHPMDILEAFEAAGANSNQSTLNALWDEFGDATASLILEGARTLAMIWESAWTAGKGGSMSAGKLKRLDPDDLRNKYIDTAFVHSLTLDQIGKVLK